ncbi:TonB-dependent receptor [Fulvivirga sedimenti]|uniref:TonB-dependent receptor plug domain-containing protein n=1 Tax=Fulvivirga sedimenti TaxID=2879465 RepID=A0A9X1HSN1_9BACT|nr:TonB-dependent receptor [Fulvivirga sedimenti]MCA6074921.1 TonB-dependent receptor plug domain-containing protein [Fulvivirga sedimenti]MCA6076098.1 TonB-dependent receptor plug domain-containing protein [Fulvivirga sedimenti]MCA6077226.1 TonB-dependent receptor plug domain-containing protein [Fulvivirga sedimenti]
MIRSLPIFLFVLFSAALYGQSRIQILDNRTNLPIAGATIQCDNGFSSIADEEGYMQIASGVCVIRHVGYEPLEISDIQSASSRLYLTPRLEVLPTVVIQGYQEPVSLKEVAGGYSFLPGKEISTFSAVTPVTALNSLAGVRMEQRSPASYRINIRGSTLRSPFGVRNVKVYWNNIPLTEPTGNTPLNMLALEQLGNVQIIRGPAGSSYGAGIGGVILMENEAGSEPGLAAEAALTVGSYQMRRLQAGVSFVSKEHSIQLQASKLTSEGYRDHSRSERGNIVLSGTVHISDRQKLGYHLLAADLFYQLPGGLTEEQAEEDPTMARTAAVSQNSLIDQQYLLAGVDHSISWDKGSNQTQVFFSSSSKRNPFITNYEFENLGGGGIRTRFNQDAGPVRFTIGGEWQWGTATADNFGNAQGFPDTLRYADENRQFTGFEYLQVSYARDNWHFSLAGSINHLSYNFNRLRDAGLDSSYTLERPFDVIFSPRVSVVRKLGDFSIHGSYGQGFSPPGLDEVRTSDASINTDLKSEIAHNFEIGFRGNFFNERLAIDLNAFYMRQRNTIVSQIDANGTSTFTNAGKTGHAGLEVLSGLRLIENNSALLNYLYLKTAVTWYRFTFLEYVRVANGENTDFSDNSLTGTPDLSLNVWLTARIFRNLQADLNYQHVSVIPLNDANTVFSKKVDLLQLNLQWTMKLNNKLSLAIFGGVDNLLNRSYSLGNDLNAFGSRYFNPAAERNYFGGIRILFNQPGRVRSENQ